MDTHTIFFVGKPGCGKGTQTKFLADAMEWPIISAGKQFRAIAAEATPVGAKVKEEIDAGFLEPHWLAMYLYLKSLFALPEGSSAIFDGFNRKVPEAELVIDSLAWLGRSFQVVYINISDDEVKRRIALRKETSGRADDDAVTKRLEEYAMYTEPAISLFRKQGALLEVNGEQTPEALAADVRKALGV